MEHIKGLKYCNLGCDSLDHLLKKIYLSIKMGAGIGWVWQVVSQCCSEGKGLVHTYLPPCQCVTATSGPQTFSSIASKSCRAGIVGEMVPRHTTGCCWWLSRQRIVFIQA